uniref:Uncharacterized protein n=1 Tax=Brassica oleracea var. oleracea TaxID=109376 RepID=A0A0D3BYX4_BRAOL
MKTIGDFVDEESQWWWLSPTKNLVGLLDEEVSVALVDEESRWLSSTKNLGGSQRRKITVARRRKSVALSDGESRWLDRENWWLSATMEVPLKRQSLIVSRGNRSSLQTQRETLKKRKCEDEAAQSSSSHAEAHEGSNRPPGVKAAKATGWTISIRRASCSGSDDGVRVAKAEKEINH